MGFFDSLKAWFSREAAEAKESASDLKTRLESDLDRRERELAATPEERMEMIADEIEDDPFAGVRAKIERQQARAEALEDLAETEPPVEAPEQDRPG